MIEISGLTKAYGDAEVLGGIDLRVGDAEIGAIVGPSGAGKSTLSRCITLLERPSSGSVVVNGRDLTRLRGRELRTARREIGTVFQSANLLSRLTAAQNIALPMRHAGLPGDEIAGRVRELLDRVGMLHRANHYPSQLSGGQQQRVGIARGLALRPGVLLSDEATAGLDPDSTRAILTLLDELRTDLGVTILVITHEMDVVRAVADRVHRLDHGRIVEQGRVSEIVRGGSPLSRALLPLPATAPSQGLRSWSVRYDAPDVSPAWLTDLAAELRTPIALLAAAVEDADDTPVGRLTLGISPDVDPALVRAGLAARGLATEGPLTSAPATGEEDAA